MIYYIDIVLLIVAFIGGFGVGLVGVGSTLLVLPTLVIVFPRIFPHQVALKMAVATALATATVAATSTAIAHIRRRNVNLKIFTILAPIYLIIAILGPQLVHAMPIKYFQILISILLIGLSIFLFIRKKLIVITTAKEYKRFQLIIVGIIAGLINSISGIATGAIMVPYLARHLPRHQAVATSVTSTILACGVATLSYVVSGWGNTASEYALGYLHVPTFLLMSIGVICAVPLGVRLSNKIQMKWFVKILASFILIAGITTLVKSFY